MGKQPMPKIDPLVQQTRNRFHALLKTGLRATEASRIANDEARAIRDGLSPPDSLTKYAQRPAALLAPAQQKVATAPAALDPNAPIPADWQDYPWPELRRLAENFTTRVTGKVQARAAITAEIGKRAAATQAASEPLSPPLSGLEPQ
jgi:hypothetical protein